MYFPKLSSEKFQHLSVKERLLNSTAINFPFRVLVSNCSQVLELWKQLRLITFFKYWWTVFYSEEAKSFTEDDVSQFFETSSDAGLHLPGL